MDMKFLFLVLPLFMVIQGAFANAACKDEETVSARCPGWSSAGYCAVNHRYHGYMKKNCMKSCGFCVLAACKDEESVSAYCPGWSASRYCDVDHIYHDYMKKNCMKSCGFCGTVTTPKPTTSPTSKPTGTGSSTCDVSSKLDGCSFDSDSCDFIDVPFDDNHDFKIMSSGGQNGGGYLSSSGQGKAQLIYPLDLLVSHNKNYGAMCMEFYYRLNSASSTLTIYEVKNAKNYPKQTKVRLSGSQSSWTKKRFTFSASQSNHILIEANPYSGSVDIDNVRFCDGSCN